MPTISGPAAFLHRGAAVLVTVDYDVRIPLKKARIAHAGVCGRISGASGRQESIDAMIAAVLEGVARYGYVGRLVSREHLAIAFAVTPA